MPVRCSHAHNGQERGSCLQCVLRLREFGLRPRMHSREIVGSMTKAGITVMLSSFGPIL